MKYGFVKTVAATPRIHVADVDGNTKLIQKCIDRAKQCGAQLLVFPELCITGYSCGDLFLQESLLQNALESLNILVKYLRDSNMLVFIGVPFQKNGIVYDCAAVINNGKLLALVPKQHFESHEEAYENRVFRLYNGENCIVTVNGQQVLFGNKIVFQDESSKEFTVSAELHGDLFSVISPSVFHTQSGANIVAGLSAEHEIVKKSDYRHAIIRTITQKTSAGYVYVGASVGESTTDHVFSSECLMYECGEMIACKDGLDENEILVSELDLQRIVADRRRGHSFENCFVPNGYDTVLFSAQNDRSDLTRRIDSSPFIPHDLTDLNEFAEHILSIQSMGLKNRLVHIHAKSAVLGISGGLDSTLALLATVRAFDSLQKDRKDIVAVTMPCFGTTQKTKNNAVQLAELLGVTVRTIPIEQSVRIHFADIGHDEAVRNAAYENSQARMRTMVLMDLANDVGGIVVGTGDLSELALGWATYNGDHMSMYSVNADIPKTLMQFLVLYEADRLQGDLQKVLTDIVNTEISPELLPAKDGKISQKTEELVGPYELHDFYLYYIIKYGFSPEKIYFLAKNAFTNQYSDEILKKWLKQFYKRFFSQQFKRSCQPDGVSVGLFSLSPRGGWNMPSDAVSDIWLKEIEEL